jgi:hypothetical protein
VIKKEAAEYHQYILAQVKEGERVEKEKERKMEDQRAIVAVARKEQVDEVLARRDEELREKIAIGEAMKKRAQEMLEEEVRAHEAKQRRARENRDQVVAANEKLKALRIELAKEERRAQEARDAEVQVVEDRKNERKLIEQRFQEKAQVKRQSIIDKAIKLLAEKTNNEAALLDKQAEEIRLREDNAMAEKAEMRRKEREAIDRSRIEAIQARNEAWQRETEEDERLRKLWRDENQAAMDEEKNKVLRAKERVRELKNMQYSDGLARRQKKVNDKLSEIEADRILQASEGDVDVKFLQACKETIRKYEAEGKPTYPLKVALNYKEPVLIGAKLTKPSGAKN